MKLAIKEMRKKLHISQAEFAEAMGVSMRTVGSWERGESLPRAEQLWNCAEVLECTPNDIMGWNEEAGSFSSDKELASDERELISNYREGSPEWQKNIAMTAKLAAGDSKQE